LTIIIKQEVELEMKPQFSEFTYGYTLTEEISKKYRFRTVPIFPSLVEEGRVGGYDVKLDIGIPIFLQFKRSDFLSTANAKYHKYFKSQYYRFNLHASKYSKQHSLLLDLERKGHHVFYVAPKFHSQNSLHNYYFGANLIKKSIWVTPLNIGDIPDDKEHSVCFNKSTSLVYFCSEPRKIEISSINEAISIEEFIYQKSTKLDLNKVIDIDNVIKEEDESNDNQPESMWLNTFQTLSDILKERQPSFSKKILNNFSEEENLIMKTAKLARIGFGLDMLLLEPEKKSD
jgi:hypothetical protein